ncbi:hypothetical protein VPH35_019891 [Triticum aestivum]
MMAAGRFGRAQPSHDEIRPPPPPRRAAAMAGAAWIPTGSSSPAVTPRPPRAFCGFGSSARHGSRRRLPSSRMVVLLGGVPPHPTHPHRVATLAPSRSLVASPVLRARG